jgi:hypothetical protein
MLEVGILECCPRWLYDETRKVYGQLAWLDLTLTQLARGYHEGRA